MATNQYFRQYNTATEQSLINDLIVEAIKIYGLDMYYLPRTIENKSTMWNESVVTSYNSAYEVELYIRNIDGFAGDGEFLSKFGVEIRDQVTFTMAQSQWTLEVGTTINKVRPQEGDCIFFPFTNALYQIKYVNVKSIFFQLGALQTYDIVCELYEGSSDIFNTGISDIDDTYNAHSLDQLTYEVLDESGNPLLTESGDYIISEDYNLETIDVVAMNDEFVIEGVDFIDFTEIDPFSERASVS